MLDRRTYAAAPLAASALWGGMYVVSKWGFAAVPPVTLAFLRVAVGAAVLYALVRVRSPDRARGDDDRSRDPNADRAIPAADRRRFAVLGFWVALTLVAQFVGTDLTTASQGALLTVLTPVFTLLLGVAVLDEALTARKTGGMALAAAGTLAVLAGQYDLARVAAGSALGVLALLVASVGWAAYTVYGLPVVRRYSALETATYSTLAAVPMLALLVPVELAVRGLSPTDLPVTPGVVAAVLYLGVLSTAAAWYLWYRGVAFVDAGTVAVFFFAQPAVGALLGVVLLGESLGLGFVVGGLVMALGIYVVSTAPSDVV